MIIVELGYTSEHEDSHAGCLARKRSQHLLLVQLLRAAGWTILCDGTEPVHIVLLGTSATIYSWIAPTLVALGLHASQSPSLLQALHVHAVQSAWSIVALRRKLERMPSVFRSSPPVILDPA